MTIRFAVFRLEYKTHKVKETSDGSDIEHEYTLTFKDGLGNTLKVKADEEDFESYEPGAPLLWEMVLRQQTLEEAQKQ